MKTPDSFRLAFKAQLQIGEEIKEKAGGQLRRICADHGWLSDSRVKSYESALAKFQRGTLASLEDLSDLYAATVVVPTRDELDEAVNAIRAKFRDARAKPQQTATIQSARTFRYDDIHLDATLGSTAPGVDDVIRKRRFEIQVRTGLQFAWWRATHDQIYKGPIRSWRLERTANQVRGSIELLDGVLADLPRAATLIDERTTDEDARFTLVVGWLDNWPDERRPSDRDSFYLAVTAWLKQAGMGIEEMERMLDSERAAEFIAMEDITPVQVIQALAAEDKGGSALVSGPLHLLRTEEFAAASPEIASVDDSKCVMLA